jgi:2-polyprenyl-3-methyl-5-hydroxy-6-metoxy-1,4-benzoquinol methylase
MEEYRYPYDRVTLQRSTEKLIPQNVRRILDIGGGHGGNGMVIKKKKNAEFLCCIDISREALDSIEYNVDAKQQCNIEEPDTIESVFSRHGPFDLILILDVLEHLVDPWRVVARLNRLMSIGDSIIVSIPNIQNYRYVIRSALGTFDYKNTGLFDRTHLRFFSKKSAIKLMTSSGLKLIATERTFGTNSRDIILSKLDFGLLSPWLTMQNLIVVKKLSDEFKDPGHCGSTVTGG